VRAQTLLLTTLAFLTFAVQAFGGTSTCTPTEIAGVLRNYLSYASFHKGWHSTALHGVELEALIDELGASTVLHYSSLEGIQSIYRSGAIVAAKKGYSYFTKDAFNPAQVEGALFANMPEGRGKGAYVIILKLHSGTHLVQTPARAAEFREIGTHRFNPEDVIYAGPNPF
jgi:hypothetical protein